MTFKKGDIIWVDLENRHPSKLKHPAVIWDNEVDEESDFYGVMLTHSIPSELFDNIQMEEEHFEKGHDIIYSNTHFVNQLFIKFQEWGPFYKSGILTKSGVEFIEKKLTNTKPLRFEEYK
jgi:hypothetical protein